MAIKIALGTKSEDKLAILESYLEVEGLDAKVEPVEVESKVDKQPRSEKDTIDGAINRAKAAREKLKSDWGIGMEGGLEKVAGLGYFLVCVVAITDADGQIYVGVSGKLQLPLEVSKLLEQNKAFGDEIRKYADLNDGEATQDLVSLLISRREAFIQALVNALMFMRHRQEARSTR